MKILVSLTCLAHEHHHKCSSMFETESTRHSVEETNQGGRGNVSMQLKLRAMYLHKECLVSPGGSLGGGKAGMALTALHRVCLDSGFVAFRSVREIPVVARQLRLRLFIAEA